MKVKVLRDLKKKLCIIEAFLLLLFVLAGCQKRVTDSLVPAGDVVYDGPAESVTEVKRGDLKPVFEKTLSLVNSDEDTYRYTQNEATRLIDNYDVEVDEVKVNVGDRVNVGDVLVTLKSKVLDDKLKEYQKQRAEDILKLEHYRNMVAIDPNLDMTYEIESVKADIAIANISIEDINKTYSELNIISESSGMVSYVDASLQDGYIAIGSPLIKVFKGAGIYVFKPDVVEIDESAAEGGLQFKPGDVYTGVTFLEKYDLEVMNPAEGKAYANGASPTDASFASASPTDADNASPTDAAYKPGDDVYFKLLGNDNVVPSLSLILTYEQPEIKDAVYVEKGAVIEAEDGNYVFIKTENDDFKAVRVTVGGRVDDYIVIREGLEGGEIVAVK